MAAISSVGFPALSCETFGDPAEIADAIGSFLASEKGMPVSVIMPALNAGRFIEAAIGSLLRERTTSVWKSS